MSPDRSQFSASRLPAGVDLRGAVRERVVGSEHGGKRAVLDLDEQERRGGHLGRGRHDEGDGIAHLANPGLRQDRLVLHLAPVAVLARNVPRGQDRLDARQPARALRVDAHDLRMGVGAPQDARVQHPLDREVRRVEGAARRLVQRVRAHVPGRPRGLGVAVIRRPRWPAANRALLPVGHPLDRVHDAAVARAPAEVAAEPAHDLRPAGPRVAFQQRGGRHDHPRRAEPALDGICHRESLLQRVRARRVAQPFDREDVLARRPARGRPARARSLPVDHDDAGPARAVVAALLGPGQPEALAEQLEQPPVGRGINAARSAVHHQVHARRLGHVSLPAISIPKSLIRITA